MKIVFTNCDFELNHTKIIPFNCSNSPYFGNLFNLGITELEIYNAQGSMPSGTLVLSSYVGANSHTISNIVITDGGNSIFNKNFPDFSPAIDLTVDAVTEHTATDGNITVRIKGNFKTISDAVLANTGLPGSNIQGEEQNGCFNWRID